MASDHAAKPIIVFDVNETLLDIEILEPLFRRLFGSGHAMREWFAQLILYSEALTLAGAYAPGFVARTRPMAPGAGPA
jgi:2-haloacid dehalogenase